MADATDEPQLAPTIPDPGSDATPSGRAALGRGATVGRFTVLELIGTGGMGVVVAAYDPQLERKVAIKLLRSDVWRGDIDEGKRRLQREAQAMARLNHPNVVTVHEVGTLGEDLFLVMEHVAGTHLGAWLREAPRAPATILAAFVAAGRGLLAAHRAGVVHRDFKPENVLVATDGHVLVTDFGLASGLAPKSSGDGASADTLAGAGTPRFMAPEQHAGGRTDARTDQYAFCVALFEALQGRYPFDAESGAALIAAKRDGAVIAPSATRGIDPRCDAAIRRGLSADPDARWPSMAELLAVLEHRPRRRWPIVVAVLGAAAVASAVVVSNRGGATPAPAPPLIEVSDTRRLTHEAGCEEFPSFTPDGKTILYDAAVPTGFAIFSLDLASGESRRLTHFDGWDYAPAVSPDGTRFAFLREDNGTKTMIAPLPSGEPARRLVGGWFRPAWSADPRYLWAGPASWPGLYDADSGVEQLRLAVPAGSQVLYGAEGPDRELLSIVYAESGQSLGLAILSPDDPPRWITRGWYQESIAVLPGERGVLTSLLEATAGNPTLVRVGFDGTVEPLPVGAIVARTGLDISADGRHIVWSTCRDQQDLVVATVLSNDRRSLEPLPAGDWDDRDPTAVPGTSLMIVVSDREGPPDLWVVDITGNVPARRLPSEGVLASGVAVSADREWVVYTSGKDVGTSQGLMVLPFDGSAPPRLLTPTNADTSPTFGADGHVYFDRAAPSGDAWDVMRIPLAGGDAEVVVANADTPEISPDGTTLIYLRNGVAIVRELATGAERPLSDTAGSYTRAAFSPDGKRLAVTAAKTLTVIDVATGAIVDRFDGGTYQLGGVAVVGDQIVADRVRWEGDLWIAELARPLEP